MIRQRNIQPGSGVGEFTLFSDILASQTGNHAVAHPFANIARLDLVELGIACTNFGGTSPTADLVVSTKDMVDSTLNMDATVGPVGHTTIYTNPATYQVTSTDEWSQNRAGRGGYLARVDAPTGVNDLNNLDTIIPRVLLSLGGTTPDFSGWYWAVFRAWYAREI